jgi:uncharacterized membrane protein YadS
MATLRSFNALPVTVVDPLTGITGFLTVVSKVALGLSVEFVFFPKLAEG